MLRNLRCKLADRLFPVNEVDVERRGPNIKPWGNQSMTYVIFISGSCWSDELQSIGARAVKAFTFYNNSC